MNFCYFIAFCSFYVLFLRRINTMYELFVWFWSSLSCCLARFFFCFIYCSSSEFFISKCFHDDGFYPFVSIPLNPVGDSCRAGLVVMNVLTFCLYRKDYSSLTLKDSFITKSSWLTGFLFVLFYLPFLSGLWIYHCVLFWSIRFLLRNLSSGHFLTCDFMLFSCYIENLLSLTIVYV